MNGSNQMLLNAIPLFYDENNITLMTRDPNCLFAYWELAEDRKEAFIREFGRSLWNKSIPALKVYNLTYNYSFYVTVNDSSNSWYINVKGKKNINTGCMYMVEIGRKISDSFFISMAASNTVTVPPNTESTNTTVHFADYREIKAGKTPSEVTMYLKNIITRETKTRFPCEFTAGSSPTGMPNYRSTDNLYGLSSAELQQRDAFFWQHYVSHKLVAE